MISFFSLVVIFKHMVCVCVCVCIHASTHSYSQDFNSVQQNRTLIEHYSVLLLLFCLFLLVFANLFSNLLIMLSVDNLCLVTGNSHLIKCASYWNLLPISAVNYHSEITFNTFGSSLWRIYLTQMRVPKLHWVVYRSAKKNNEVTLSEGKM